MPQPPLKPSATILIVYVAFIGSTFVYVLIGGLLYRSDVRPVLEGETASMMTGIIAALALGILVAVANLKKRYLSDSSLSGLPITELRKHATSKCMILFALSEVPAILGLVLFFLTYSFWALAALWAVSLVCFSAVRPSKNMLSQIDSQE